MIALFFLSFSLQSIMQESEDVTLNFGEEDELDQQKRLKWVEIGVCNHHWFIVETSIFVTDFCLQSLYVEKWRTRV